jgi:hypothetical protein
MRHIIAAFLGVALAGVLPAGAFAEEQQPKPGEASSPSARARLRSTLPP